MKGWEGMEWHWMSVRRKTETDCISDSWSVLGWIHLYPFVWQQWNVVSLVPISISARAWNANRIWKKARLAPAKVKHNNALIPFLCYITIGLAEAGSPSEDILCIFGMDSFPPFFLFLKVLTTVVRQKSKLSGINCLLFPWITGGLWLPPFCLTADLQKMSRKAENRGGGERKF